MMKKTTLRIIALILMLSLCLTACGGKDPTPTDPCADGHTYDNACDTVCNVCEGVREVEGHIYDNACDKRCNACDFIREVGDHEFDNACDADCNICGKVRNPEDHVDTDGDYHCDECGVKLGEPPCEHEYDNECDTDCNLCGAVRATSHKYTGNCDGECNVCGATREPKHSYTNACDPDCNICGATRSVSDHVDERKDGRCDICGAIVDDGDFNLPEIPAVSAPTLDLSGVPEFDNSKEYVAINGNIPFFLPSQLVTEAYAHYSELDSLGRAGMAVACLGKELFPTADRGSLPNPTGWHSNSIYERSHLIAHSLAGYDGANNLITGTYDLNGVMQTFEDQIKDFIIETNYHVMYRITPIFEGNNLVASGIVMEGISVEDGGEGICFCIYVYNEQDDEIIDHATGDVSLPARNYTFVLNTNNYKIHRATCSSVAGMNDENKMFWEGTYAELYAYVESLGKVTSKINRGTCKPQNASARQLLFTLPEKKY